VFAVKGETLEEYWDYTHRIFEWPMAALPNMILDDGGDATLLVHLGARAAEKDLTAFLDPTNEEEEVFLRPHQASASPKRPGWFARGASIKGVTEETTTGVHRLYEMQKKGSSCSRPSTSTTRSPSRSSTTSTAAVNRWSTASAAAPT
jgi:adenosylhomocysteinase